MTTLAPLPVPADAVVDPRLGGHGPALLALEDGTVFRGVAFGAPVALGGDIVVNTSQTGYQEVCTDPSYAGQVVVMTYPLIGNHGRLSDDDQSEQPWLRGLVVGHATAAVLGRARQIVHILRTSGVPAIAGLDTRAVARHLRESGCQRAVITAPNEVDPDAAVARARRIERWEDQDFVGQVSAGHPYEVGNRGPLVAVVDYGLKTNIVRALQRRGVRVRVLPHTASADLALAPDVSGLVLSPGPGDPARLDGPVALARAAIVDGRPLLGICLGHQVVARAAGAETRRLRFGHHGANHPVRDVETGRVQVTAQNHEVEVVGESLPADSGFEVSQRNLNDGSVEGLRHRTLPIETVQYHPEGSPGPLDAVEVFDRFLAHVRAYEAAASGPDAGSTSSSTSGSTSSAASGSTSSAASGSTSVLEVSAGHQPARDRPRSVLILGSGPVVIGQAAEFDYAGTQACRALREEGVRTILLNSNPATIMTDPGVADVVYLEPLTAEVAERILLRERPDGILAGLGGQTALNLAMDLARSGALERTGTRLLGTPIEAIEMAEDREHFRDLLDRIGQPYAPSEIVDGATDAEREAATERALERIGLPAVIRPAFTLGGTGGGIVATEPEYRERVRTGLRMSPIHQVMVERCLVGWQEIEYEVMRDADDTCIAVCSMENVDPLGVHTGDSIVVAPVQTLPDPVHQRLRSAALAIIRALGVEGGCNVQFALSPDGAEYAVIEVNPRVSRSSALASKATGYPIARVAAQIAVGRRLAEIPNAITGTTVAAFEPALDYVVVKLPRFPFDKFPTADRSLGSQMKATGEVMAIDRTFGAALNKALRGLEQAGAGLLAEDPAWLPTLQVIAGPERHAGERPPAMRREELLGEVFVGEDGLVCADRTNAIAASRPILLRRFLAPSDSRLWRLLALLRRGVPAAELQAATGIAPWFVGEMERLIDVAERITEEGRSLSDALLVSAKRAAFGDRDIATLSGLSPADVASRRLAIGLRPGFAMVDTCAAEFVAETPYFYSTYAATGSPPEAPPVVRPAALVIGSGPVRIGQGIEFDYCAVQASATLRADGWSAVMVNSNPETVSTDFDSSSRLYFEPLDSESVLAVLDAERPVGAERRVDAEPLDAEPLDAETPVDAEPLPALVQFGGQTPLNLAGSLVGAGVPLPGLSLETIELAEERTRFAGLVERLGIPQPDGGIATSLEEALVVAERVGYPVIVRPSFVIGGLAIDFCFGPSDLARQLATAAVVSDDRPLRIDAYLEGLEVDVDAVCDGERVLIPGLMEHIERAGVHSGDSVAMFPPQRLSTADQESIVEAMRRLALAVGVRGLINAQFIVREDGVYVLEVNPRASRTVPFISKVTGVPMVALATRVALGARLADLGWADGLLSPPPVVAVKAPVFSTSKLRGVDPSLGPGMQSTGEVIGLHADPDVALAKALIAASLRPPVPDATGALALLSIADRDKSLVPALAAALARAGYRFAATRGTAEILRAEGHAVVEVARLGDPEDDRPGILWLIASGSVSLVVNTPSPRTGPVRDAAAIRHATIAEGILCLTSIDTAVAAARSLDPALRDRLADVRPLEEWLAGGTSRATGGAELPDGGVDRPAGGEDQPDGREDQPDGGVDRPTGGAELPDGGEAHPSDGTGGCVPVSIAAVPVPSEVKMP